MPNTSIIISMYNSRFHDLNVIENLLLPSLLNNADSNKQLVIIDDVSPLNQTTQKLIEKYFYELNNKFGDFKFIQNKKNLGFSQSYNFGAYQSDGEILLPTNSDVYFQKGTIDSLAKVADNKQSQVGPVSNSGFGFQTTNYFKDLLGGKHIANFSKSEINKIEEINIFLNKNMKNKIYPDHSVSGFCFAIPKKKYEEVGGFDPNLRIFLSDVKISQHMKGKVLIDASSYVYHHDEKSICTRTLYGELKPLVDFIPDAMKYIIGSKSILTPIMLIQKAYQNLTYKNTITQELKKLEK